MPLVLKISNIKEEFQIRKGIRTLTLKALRGVDLELNEQEILSIVGESGCGKTTLLRVLARIYEPTDGVIELFGNKVPKNSVVQKNSNLEKMFKWSSKIHSLHLTQLKRSNTY